MTVNRHALSRLLSVCFDGAREADDRLLPVSPQQVRWNSLSSCERWLIGRDFFLRDYCDIAAERNEWSGLSIGSLFIFWTILFSYFEFYFRWT